ncbi:coagulation factor XIII A chain [Danio rerio]|uniref:Coagulation factor XIII A chain n=2 Tax=Danio rerio TaxID=7955 RepID=A0A8N7UUR6_DANRE
MNMMSLKNQPAWRWGARAIIDKSNSLESNPPPHEKFPTVSPRGPTDEAIRAASLSVLSIDMRVTENKNVHHTDTYKGSNLIVRRNTEFTIILKLDRAFNEQQHQVELEFLIGSSPDENKGTYIIVSIGKEKQDSSWKSRVVAMHGNSVMVGITPDAKCIIGRFRIFAVVVSVLGKERTQRNPDTDFYVLFNPWNSEDEVYMDKEEDRQEYVMNEVGTIYNGVHNNITTRSWNFGQFEEGVLDACLTVMDAGNVPLLFRGNATEVVRQASALMNSQGDNGVLVGSWSGDYSSGTAPTAWTGSPEILLKYASEGCVPVCFAQCWVFAGTLNTFVRCLGIPGRVVTNYCSAHDNTGNLKTDIVLDEDGRMDKSRTRDSVWNYHCWNEVFMKRLDLPDQYSGWQVVDCTPQETSDGLFRCGPTSVNAIKEGELSYPFDARFVFAELNSDVIYHKSNKYGKTKIIHVDTSYVGKQLVTKKHDSNDYMDITSSYKYSEASLKERQVMQMAERRGVPSRKYLTLPEAGVEIQIQTNTIKIGDDFRLTMNIKNKSSKACTVIATVTGCVVFYTGITGSDFKLENKKASVQASKTEPVTIDIKAVDYTPHLVEQANLLFVVYGIVEETETPLTTMRVINLQLPELTIKMSGSPRVGSDLLVSVEFTNPYNFPLLKVELRLDGPGLIQTKVKHYSQILPGASVNYTVSIVPRAHGKKVLMACLDCSALRQVTNQLEFEVLKKELVTQGTIRFRS